MLGCMFGLFKSTTKLRIVRCFTSETELRHRSEGILRDTYKRAKAKCQSKKLPKDINPQAVFACNELDLKDVNVYGFDYDYTLACYKPAMDYLLYNLGRSTLIQQHKYPKELTELEYKPDFAVRGLHYDIEKGVLLKLDSFLQLQLGTVYRGLTPLSTEEVLSLYKNRIIPITQVEGHTNNAQLILQDKSKMTQLADQFSVPEIGLMCNIVDYFERNRIKYNPQILFSDVQSAIKNSHPIMHKVVSANLAEYVESDPNLRTLLERLKNADKKIFLLTNSPYHFVNPGMEHIIGKDWRDYFDLLIVQAGKPKFFTDPSRPLRIYHEQSDNCTWDRVTKLEKGNVYYEGTVSQLQRLTGWQGNEVLYFGDHLYTDLADLTLKHGWRTGAIIRELTDEIGTLNKPEFKKNACWLQMLTQLTEKHQHFHDKAEQKVLARWIAERDGLRNDIKCKFNQHFGSIFRTNHNTTYFSRRLFRFADIYTSNITNLLHYSVNETFYPREIFMPHEYSS